MYSNKFFYDFHVAESSFTCPRLRTSGLAWSLSVIVNIYCMYCLNLSNFYQSICIDKYIIKISRFGKLFHTHLLLCVTHFNLKLMSISSFAFKQILQRFCTYMTYEKSPSASENIYYMKILMSDYSFIFQKKKSKKHKDIERKKIDGHKI